MGDVVYQENMFVPIILLHIYGWKILKLSDFMFDRVDEHLNL